LISESVGYHPREMRIVSQSAPFEVFDHLPGRRSWRNSVAAAVVLVVLLMVMGGCDGGDPVEPSVAHLGAQAERTVVEEPDASTGDPVGGGARKAPDEAAADVIRTRIAWRDREEGGGPWPTPTPPPPLPVTTAGGTVWASEIALMWTEVAAGGFEYGDATAYCAGLSIGEFNDWRVPTLQELELLMATEFQPSWAGGMRTLWTSTPYEFRGVHTLTYPGPSRSHQEVGMAHVVCVRLLG
jgi:hypothetical protein